MRNTIDYADYEKLIYNLAHRFHRTTGIEKDELISAANLEFMLCQETYDPLMAKFSTYLTTRVKGLFLEMARKRRNNIKTLQFVPRLADGVYGINNKFISGKGTVSEEAVPNKNGNPEDYLFFKEILRGLSSDAKEVCGIIFETPKDLINMIIDLDQPRGVNKHQIQKHLRKQGWTFSRIWKTFKEISLAL